MSGRTIIVGDIHGCYDELMALLEKAALGPSDLRPAPPQDLGGGLAELDLRHWAVPLDSVDSHPGGGRRGRWRFGLSRGRRRRGRRPPARRRLAAPAAWPHRRERSAVW
mgnify:CR=1 FL=1